MADAFPNGTLSILCDPSADIEFESSDGVLFRVHSNHLVSTSFGFSPEEGTVVADSQPVKLPEPAEILEILFQFVEPPSESRHHQYPSLADLDPHTLFALAEAAEKYIVFACMSMCATRMRFDTVLMEAHALEILNHSFKHGYNDLVLKSVMRTLRKCNFELVAEKLTAPGLLVKRLKYYGKWRQVSDFGNELFESDTAIYQCPKLYAKWGAYNRQCARPPIQAGIPEHSYAGVPRQITSLPCQLRPCPCD